MYTNIWSWIYLTTFIVLKEISIFDVLCNVTPLALRNLLRLCEQQQDSQKQTQNSGKAAVPIMFYV